MKRIRTRGASSARDANSKRGMLPLLAFILFVAIAARAEYINPLGWEGNPYYTHQSWDFGTGQSPVNADVDLNPFGEPKLGIHGLHIDWLEETLGREGVWTIKNGWAQVEGIFPNEQNEHLSKEVWIQISLHTSIRGGAPIDVFFEYPPGSYVATAKESSVVPDADGWVYQTYLFELTPQPDWEVIGLNFSVPVGDYVAIDELVVDTRCIPEAATLSLLSLGGLMLQKRRQV